jgi:hypothetical protein
MKHYACAQDAQSAETIHPFSHAKAAGFGGYTDTGLLSEAMETETRRRVYNFPFEFWGNSRIREGGNGMNLDEAQKKRVKEWIEEGLKLSEIQKKLATEFELHLTYMDARFLLADLGLEPKDKPAQATPTEIGKAPPQGAAVPPGKTPPSPLPPEPLPPAGAGVSVAVDQVMRAGALASGKVTFSDNKSAEWYIDQMGRLGLVPKEQGYKPSEEDLMDFQAELQQQLAKLGY